MATKPLGVKLVAGFAFLCGCGIVVIVLYGITHRDTVAAWTHSEVELSVMADRIAFILPLEAAMAFVLAGGLWTMQEWARMGTLGACAYILVKTAFQRTHLNQQVTLPLSTIDLLIASECLVLVPIAIYLQLPRVRSWFKPSPEH